jgi:uncharacterized protein YcbK (DUF882 family)
MQKIILLTFAFLLFLVSLYISILYTSLSPLVKKKERILSQSLTEKGLKSSYIIISGYRPPWLNKITPLAAKNSVHQVGKAIDIYVFDVNGDWKINRKDVDIIVQELEKIDHLHPQLAGGLGTYFKSSPQMVHFDVSGGRRRWKN